MFSLFKKKGGNAQPSSGDERAKQSRRRIFGDAGIIIGSLLIAGAVLYWFGGFLGAKAEKIAADRGLIHRRSKILETLAELKRVAPEAAQYKTKIDAVLPAKDQLLDFPGWFEGFARVHQLKLVASFQQAGQVEAKNDSAGYISFGASAEGQYENIVAFLKDVENNPQRFFVDITTIAIEKRIGNYSASMSGKVFFK